MTIHKNLNPNFRRETVHNAPNMGCETKQVFEILLKCLKMSQKSKSKNIIVKKESE